MELKGYTAKGRSPPTFRPSLHICTLPSVRSMRESDSIRSARFFHLRR